jgi:response regulator RpfG family c-di-GMP phosphodiesterase
MGTTSCSTDRARRSMTEAHEYGSVARILIVDDEQTNVGVLSHILSRVGYTNVETTTDPRLVLPLYQELQPDLILLDLHMPDLDGFAILEQLAPLIPPGAYLPVLTLTGDARPETKQRALSMGAKDFLTKPFDLIEVLLRIQNLLETRFLHLQLQDQNQVLELKVAERTTDLEKAQIEILDRLAGAAEFRDDETGQHTRRVAELAAVLGRSLGLDDTLVDLIRRAAPLHDLGKLGVSDAILLKPGPLTPPEYEAMMAHVGIGTKILRGSRSKVLQLGEEIVRTHHERWDGTGYLSGTQGEDIPLSGRIVAVADVFDALVHERPYKDAWPAERALEEIVRLSGRHFDPRIVDAFVALGLETLTARFSQRLAA